ncbi:heterokaryon incompatibility protein-domain-containing protein [Xylariaceae sp. FL1651]|nr:heterokaryon incompatibility protein-domain-containing protein [Xylariaceae sp. FL1651]
MAPCEKWQDVFSPDKPGGLFFLDNEPIKCCEVCRAVNALGTMCYGLTHENNGSLTIEWNMCPKAVEILPFDLSTQEEWRFRIFTRDDNRCPWGIFPCASTERGLEPPASLCSSSIFDKIVHMIESCSSHHLCVDAELPRLPTRVIQVGEMDNNVRLVESKGMKERYICLSHCWGDHQPLKTTRSNISQHLDSLPWDDVPQCYKDLIELTRLLGVNYVWIDSLCIIQDDAEDWMTESQTMCHVYENSWLTVASTAIPDCSYNLWAFSGRMDDHKICIGKTDLGEAYSMMAARVPTWHPTNFDLRGHQRQLWPLLDRAWVFQEMMLSPRILHFSRWELIWECRESTSCECGRMEPRIKDKRFQNVLEHGTPEQLETLWREMVQGFSCLSLTFSSDKYLSLSGLAQKFSQKRPDSKYLAGLWQDSLARDILWLNIHAIPLLKRDPEQMTPPSFERAPSWSWMKMNGRVMFADSPYRYPSYLKDITTWFDRFYFTIDSSSCTLSSPYLTGPVHEGILRLKCVVFDAQLKRGFLKEGTRSVFGTKMDSTETTALRLPLGAANIGFFSENIGVNTLLYLDAPTNPICGKGILSPDGHEVKCIPLARARRTWIFEGMASWEVDEWLMVLLSTGNSEEYARIGMAIMRKKYNDEAQAVQAQSFPDWTIINRQDTIITVV